MAGKRFLEFMWVFSPHLSQRSRARTLCPHLLCARESQARSVSKPTNLLPKTREAAECGRTPTLFGLDWKGRLILSLTGFFFLRDGRNQPLPNAEKNWLFKTWRGSGPKQTVPLKLNHANVLDRFPVQKMVPKNK